MAIDYQVFRQMLESDFPEVVREIDEYSEGLLHCEMGTFARLTEEAFDTGRFWQASKYLNFVERIREEANADVENAINVSFVEYLAFGEVTENRYCGYKEQMPTKLRELLLEIDGRERWA